MGLFSSKTPEEKKLQALCEELGATAGQVSRGTVPLEYFADVWESSRAEIASLYSTITRQKGLRAARKVTQTAVIWAETWGGGTLQNRDYQSARAATDLVRGALSKTVSGPVA